MSFRFAHPAPHLTEPILASTKYMSGVSEVDITAGCSIGDGDDGWFKRNITDRVASFPPRVTSARKLCSVTTKYII